MCSKLKILVGWWLMAVGALAAPIPTRFVVLTGQAIGHRETFTAVSPGPLQNAAGGGAPSFSAPDPADGFTAAHQAAAAADIERALQERKLIKPAGPGAPPAAMIEVQFLKTEHFPDKQDYLVDAFVTATLHGNSYARVLHISTFAVGGATRLFQGANGSRRRAAGMLRTAAVEDLAAWLAAPDRKSQEGLLISRPFTECSDKIIAFVRERLPKPASPWDVIQANVIRAGASVTVVELRLAIGDREPPFCLVDIHAAGTGTRIVIDERHHPGRTNPDAPKLLRKFVDEL